MNRVVEEMIKKAKATSIANRGQYRVTIASNVFNQNGTTMEDKTDSTPNDTPTADIVVDPSTTPVNEVIAKVENGAVIEITPGEVVNTVTVDKSATIHGANAGVAQNYSQEI